MTTPKEALERARTAINAIVLSTHSVSFKADLDVIDEALASLQGEAAIRADNTANLISIIADIREKTGLGGKPMLNELADAIAAEIDRRVADEREKCAETADCLADEYDATSFTSTNAEQVAALRSKEQAAHEIAAAIRSGGGE